MIQGSHQCTTPAARLEALITTGVELEQSRLHLFLRAINLPYLCRFAMAHLNSRSAVSDESRAKTMCLVPCEPLIVELMPPRSLESYRLASIWPEAGSAMAAKCRMLNFESIYGSVSPRHRLLAVQRTEHGGVRSQRLSQCVGSSDSEKCICSRGVCF